MDPHARLRHSLAGAECAACGGAIPIDRIRLLAEREDLAFVELSCPTCSLESLGIVTFPEGPGTTGELDIGADRAGSSPDPQPIELADVVAMRRFLASHRGDIRSLLEDGGRSEWSSE